MLVEVEGLRVEIGCKRLDALGGDRDHARSESLADFEIVEVERFSPVHETSTPKAPLKAEPWVKLGNPSELTRNLIV